MVARKILRKYSVYAKKGGVYKTTLVQNLSGIASVFKGQNTLLVERDFQGNLGLAFGVNSDNVEATFSDYMLGKSSLENATINLYENIDGILDNDYAIFLENRMKEEGIDIEERFLTVIDEIEKTGKYDNIIFDLPARQDMLSALVFNNVDKLIIPFELAPYGVDGVVKVLRDINNFKDTNDKLEIAGIVPVKGRRTKVNKQMIDQGKMIFPIVGSKFKNLEITDTTIPTSTLYDEAIVDYGRPLVFLDIESMTVKKDREKYQKQIDLYRELAIELGVIDGE
ncbi:AAA family ATPase [Enterococcus raffinosus]|uniref:ParA family protein n=1 Tax=Enterococcus raffinosus TaxID=71452 RepID=UPI00289203D9|nr:AAA family ATPase [Enterococcus raffinosus]MDT2525126.1 AAA family ATPase [Enterococcus raffinosus]MDT2592481.1 AAA family ATPase [Enterococcus raffinosus]